MLTNKFRLALSVAVLSLFAILWILPLHARPVANQAAEDTGGGVGADNRGLTNDQLLDRSLSIAGVRGLIGGVLGTPVTRMLAPESGSKYGMIVTEYPLAVDEFLGRSPSSYPIGTTILLRVPGGTVSDPSQPGGTLSMATEGGPMVRAGQRVYVFVRDQGTIAGGNTARALVASQSDDVFTVTDGFVAGQGGWAGVLEPVDFFRTHFRG